MVEQEQFMFWVYRIGQAEPFTHGVVMYNPDSEVELRRCRSGDSNKDCDLVYKKGVGWRRKRQ